MDPTILVQDFIDIYNEFKEINETLTNEQVIELMKVSALYSIAQALANIKEDK